MYWNTVQGLLKDGLILLMNAPELSQFRLVGGTSLSLQIGHRMSVDIDLFTDADYGSIDFNSIDQFLKDNFSYVDASFNALPGNGRSYIVGKNRDNSIKLDIYYTDNFIQPPLIVDNIRMATIEEIIAMKVDVIARGGRKKDFWDLHELLDNYTIPQMLTLHQQRYPYNHNEEFIRSNFKDFDNADDDFEPICLRGKYWELIKLDIINALAINE
ncbi:nucleotidyl transferase AbiEii/AbiGii toxin family protein [Mucilaginibacter sp.]|uniref:nucleotidyl transferase AbiEii/AbiGii toxin family protein n=1 Tax=Mucilaginibacter sp. TaxID=1882438 RepID=UPI00260287C5|nr:nucleotidyl transferase AbiEii/AbiGii toxin family protein [Mucilaginibacter sp.]MDB5030164.1 hypothetical protein [Mucilaginibacter sp.]